MSKKIWWLFACLILASSVFAQQVPSFIATIGPQHQTVRLNETAIYDLAIFNNDHSGQIFEAYSTDIMWDIKTGRSLFVPSRNNFRTKLFVSGLNVNEGTYSIPINIRKVNSPESVKQAVSLEVQSIYPSVNSYLPAFKGNASMPRLIEPGKEVTISLNIENLNRRNLSDVTIKLKSSILNKNYTTSLGSKEKKLLTFTTIVDGSVLPQKDLFQIQIVKVENEKSYHYDVNPLHYEVLPKENIAISKDLKKEFLKTVQFAKISNLGNIPKEQVYAQKIGFFSRLISSTNPKAKVVNGEYVWEIHLDVSESRFVYVTASYRLLAFVLLFLITGILFYYLLRSELRVKKQAIIVSAKDGGISELKIHINVKNRSRKTLTGINLIDLIPKIADVEKKFEHDMIAPSQIIKNDNKGTLLKWNIDSLDAGEEVILTYRMVSKFSILGGATLPVIVAKFTTAQGKEKTTFSNRYKVNLIR